MSYQVEYQERPGYLYVHVLGERSQDAVIALTRELVEKASELQHQRLLIDVRDFKGWLQTMESYNVVTHDFAKFKGKGLQKVAIVDREFPDTERWSFFETVARNRGFNLRIHTDSKTAIVWLPEGLDTEPAEK